MKRMGQITVMFSVLKYYWNYGNVTRRRIVKSRPVFLIVIILSSLLLILSFSAVFSLYSYYFDFVYSSYSNYSN